MQKCEENLKENTDSKDYKIEEIKNGPENFSIKACIEPHLYRSISDIFSKDKKFYGKSYIEILE